MGRGRERVWGGDGEDGDAGLRRGRGGGYEEDKRIDCRFWGRAGDGG